MRRRGRVVAALAALATVLVVVAIVVASELPGSSKGASQAPKSGGSATVERRDLVATDTESGTLSYANPQTVFNRVSGTITSLPRVGQVIKPGQTLYDVDGSPVVLFNGTVPAYRSLSEGVADGADVLELKQDLVALGFDPEHLITINDSFDAATTSAVELWQASLGESETGIVTLGQIVFMPGAQRITAVDAALGSAGGSGAGAASGSSATGASYVVPARRPEFVSLTTTGTTPTKTSRRPTKRPRPKKRAAARPKKGAGRPTGGGKTPSTLAALLALLKAETLELRKSRSSSSGAGTGGSAGATGSTGSRSGSSSSRSAGGSSAGASSAGAGSSSAASGSASAASGSASAASGSASSGGSGAGSSSSSGAGATAQEILQTTSTQLIVSVELDATKQSEAVVGEPVTVELPDGSTVDGKITQVSAVAQTSSSSSSGSAAGGATGGSSTPSATIPVTITLKGHRHVAGLDQAAVSVNFQQQVENGVLSVPVTALLATAGGGYAVQEAAAPHQLIPVMPGLFAAGYVQISGSQIHPGLQVTDSQG